MKVARNFPQQHLHMLILIIDVKRWTISPTQKNKNGKGHISSYKQDQKIWKPLHHTWTMITSLDLDLSEQHIMNTYCDSHISSLESNSNPRQATKLQKPKLSSIPQVCCVSKVCRYGVRPAYCRWTDMKLHPNAPFSNRTRSHSQWSAQFGAFCSKRATCARAMQSFPKGSSATFQSSEMGRFTKWPQTTMEMIVEGRQIWPNHQTWVTWVMLLEPLLFMSPLIHQRKLCQAPVVTNHPT